MWLWRVGFRIAITGAVSAVTLTVKGGGGETEFEVHVKGVQIEKDGHAVISSGVFNAEGYQFKQGQFA
jgi:hypothetical protein